MKRALVASLLAFISTNASAFFSQNVVGISAAGVATSSKTVSQGGGGGGGPAFVQSELGQASGAASADVAYPTNNTSGNMSVVCMSTYRSGGTTHQVTDGQGNTYTLAVSSALGDTQARVSIFYALNINAGANTVTCTSVSGAADITCITAEYSGLLTAAAQDQIAGNVQTAANPTSGARTAQQNSELILGCMGHNGGNFALTPGSGFTTRESFNDATSGMPASLEDKTISSGGSQTADWTQNSADYGALMLTLKGQ